MVVAADTHASIARATYLLPTLCAHLLAHHCWLADDTVRLLAAANTHAPAFPPAFPASPEYAHLLAPGAWLYTITDVPELGEWMVSGMLVIYIILFD